MRETSRTRPRAPAALSSRALRSEGWCGRQLEDLQLMRDALGDEPAWEGPR